MKAFLMSAAAAAILLVSQGAASAGDPIIGTWTRPAGPLVAIAPCHQGLCVKIASGEDFGDNAGTVKVNGDGTYSTKVSNVDGGNPISGKGTLVGNVLTVTQGNKEENWQRH